MIHGDCGTRGSKRSATARLDARHSADFSAVRPRLIDRRHQTAVRKETPAARKPSALFGVPPLRVIGRHHARGRGDSPTTARASAGLHISAGNNCACCGGSCKNDGALVMRIVIRKLSSNRFNQGRPTEVRLGRCCPVRIRGRVPCRPGLLPLRVRQRHRRCADRNR